MTMNSLCTGHNVESTPTRNEPHHEKTNNVVSEQVRHKLSCADTGDGQRLENFGIRKKRTCTIREAKTKTLISFAATAKLICAFVFACTK